MHSWTAWPALAAALVLLNASLTFANVWPTPKIRWENALSVELAVVVLLLALFHRHATPLARRVAPTLWLLLVVGHYLDVTAPGLYGRDFNLYWDSQHLGNVTAMLARAVPPWLIALGAGAFVALVTTIWMLSRVALRQVAGAVAHRGPRRAMAAVSSVVIALFAVDEPGGPSARVSHLRQPDHSARTPGRRASSWRWRGPTVPRRRWRTAPPWTAGWTGSVARTSCWRS